MTLTPRGRRVVLVTVAASALLAGATAQHWDPYARELAHPSAPVVPVTVATP